jgi:hypothetical protein
VFGHSRSLALAYRLAVFTELLEHLPPDTGMVFVLV